QVVVGLGDTVADEANAGGVAGEAAGVLDHAQRVVGKRVQHLGAAFVAVHAAGQRVAGGDVADARGAHGVSGNGRVQGGALQHGERLDDVEAELEIQRQRRRVIGHLHQAHAGESARGGAVEDVLHQAPADAGVVQVRVDGERPDRGDVGELPQEVASHHLAVEGGDDGVDVVAVEQVRSQRLGAHGVRHP